MIFDLAPLTGRYWRMLNVRWQHRPFDSGSHLTGGRWNSPGTPALYLSADYNTAISELHQDLIRPGTLVAFDVVADAIIDLTAADPAVSSCEWRDLYAVRGEVPPTWPIADRAIADGAAGALVRSVQRSEGTNLVLWRWHDARVPGDGAALTLLDPDAALSPAARSG